MLIIYSACKDQGSPFFSWRNPNGKIMTNIHGAYSHLSANPDTATYLTPLYAEVLGDIYDISDSIEIIAFGHCFSYEDSVIYITNTPSYDENDTNKISGHTYYDVESVDSIKPDAEAFTFTSKIKLLKPETKYYVRSYVIIRYASGAKDTAYNQTVSSFNTKIPQDMWFNKIDLNGGNRYEATAFVIRDSAYLVGGFNGLELLDDVWQFHTEEGVWTQMGEFPGNNGNGIMSAAAFVIDDTVYFGTGIINYQNMTPTAAMWKWNPQNNLPYYPWRRIDSLGTNQERYNAIAFTLEKDGEKRGYIGLGQRNQPFSDIYYYKQEADTAGAVNGAAWVQQTPFFGGGRTEAVVATLGNVAIIGSGMDENGNLKNDFYIFDPSGAGQWRSIASCPFAPRRNAVAFSLSFTRENSSTQFNYFYVGTGIDANDSLYNDWWRYDYNNGKWTQCSDIREDDNIAEGRQGAVGFSVYKNVINFGVNERGFVATGKGNSGYLNDNWEYLP